MVALPKLVSATIRYRELLKSQYWTPDRLESYVNRSLGSTLKAAAAIPFYASRFGGMPRLEEFRSVPIIKRHELAELNRSVRSLHPKNTSFISDFSSGSTGQPCEFLFDQSHQRGRFGARARYLRAHGWSPLTRSAWLVAVTGAGSPDQAFFNTLALPFAKFKSTTATIAEQAEWVKRLDPVHLYGYPSVLEGILEVLAQQQWKLPSLRCVFSSSESVDDSLRVRARALLGVEIADCYGSTEGCLAWQCERGSYHVNAEHVLVEIVDSSGHPVKSGAMGRVIVTTLENHLMPLVRYEIGDYVLAAEGKCECGRGLPLIGRVAGRALNLFRTREGTLISPWAITVKVKNLAGCGQFQVVQKTLDGYLLRYVSDRRLPPDEEARARRIFREALGEGAHVGFERVSEIARAPSGKFMVTLSELAAPDN